MNGQPNSKAFSLAAGRAPRRLGSFAFSIVLLLACSPGHAAARQSSDNDQAESKHTTSAQPSHQQAARKSSEAGWSATVGMPTKIDQLVIPGGELVAKELTRESPFVLRIVATYPHGTDFRYDLEYYGLEPGAYDLRDYLVHKDGSAVANLAPLEVSVTPILPPGQIEPAPLQSREPASLGGYRLLLLLVGLVWLAGLIGLLWLGRKRHRARAASEQAAQPSLADRLRPLVEEAMHGELTPARRAELERMLLTFWRRKLGFAETDPAVAMRQLRNHPEAGALLQQLEAWLYQRGSRQSVNVSELLAPYRNVSMAEFERQESSAATASSAAT